MKIHPTALIDPTASLSQGVEVGPYAIIDAGVKIGPESKIGPRVHVFSHTEIGEECRFYDGAIIGSDPQDLKYRGEASKLHIGDRVKVREYCTLNRGTNEVGLTKIGNDVLLMAYVHVAHDCVIEDGAVLANGVQLGGHVQIGSESVIGGTTAVHQFCEVGRGAFVGGTLKIDRHVPPWCKALGNPLAFAGINSIGMQRNGLEEEVLKLKGFYQGIYRRGKAWEEGVKELSVGVVDETIRNFYQRCQGKILSSRILS